jgi:Sporulation and spore germination/Immunoglobulin-like domain of bacterial spore germination
MIRSTRTARSIPSVALLAALAIAAAACAPASGPLGTPATPPPTSAPSVEVPTADITPGTASPTPTIEPAGSTGPSEGPSTAPTATPTPTSSPAGTIIVRAYFLVDEHLVPVLREVPKTQAVATAAMNQLLAGPNAKERAAGPALVTTVPSSTRLLGLSIDNGVATVDLSREFEAGGGSASMFGRLSQVVYTLTQFSTVDGVLFELDGQPVTIFGGEGLILDHAVGRADYHDQLPAIFVDRPAWGAALGNPGTVSGLASTFEAVFQVQLLDAAGHKLVDQYQMASCGSGCWGTFQVKLSYTVTKAQWGTLRVFDYSAKDGTPENVTEYPVWLTPAT